MYQFKTKSVKKNLTGIAKYSDNLRCSGGLRPPDFLALIELHCKK